MIYVKSHLTAIGALFVTLVATIQQAGHIDRSNVVAVAIAVLGVLLSFALQNTDGGWRHYSQAIISTLIVAGQVVAPFVINGRITYAELVIVAVSIVQGAVVFWTPKPIVDARGQDAGTAAVNVSTLAGGRHDGDEPGATSVQDTLDKARFATPEGS